MSQPDWSAQKMDPGHDVLMVWNQRIGGIMHTFRFALRRTLPHFDSRTWEPRGVFEQSIDRVGLKGTYLGNMVAISPLRQSVGAKVQPKIVFPTCTVTLARTGDSQIEDLLAGIKESKNFTDPEVWIGIFVTNRGNGMSVSIDPETDLAFLGIPEPGGAKVYWDRIEITMSDAMKKYDVELLADTYSVSETPDMDEEADGDSIPLAIGCFAPQFPPATGYCVYTELTCLDTDDLVFGVCHPGANGVVFGNIGAGGDQIVYRFDEGGNYVETCDCENPPGGWGGTASQTGIVHLIARGGGSALPWASGARYYLRLYDFEGIQSSWSQPIENPAHIWYTLLTQFAGVPAGQIDDSWTDVRDHFNENPNVCPDVRRILRGSCRLTEALEELCGEFGMMTFTQAGKFRLVKGKIWPGHPVARRLYHWDVRKDSLKVGIDPSWEHINGIRYYYSYDQGFYPSREEAKSLKASGTGAIYPTRLKHSLNGDDYFFRSTHPAGANDTLQIGFLWTWKTLQAYELANLTYQAMALEDVDNPRGVEASVIKRLTDPAFGPGDVLQFSHPSFGDDSHVAQVYEKNTDLASTITEIKAYAVSTDE